MLIEGPLRISVVNPEDGQGWMLVIAFKQEFQAMGIPEQAVQFREYVQDLNATIYGLGSADEQNRAGMLIIQQIVEQILPHIESGDLVLEENIIIQIQQNSQVVALSDLLGSLEG